MDDDALKTDHLNALMAADYLNKINNILDKWEEIVKAELSELELSEDLGSTDAEDHLVGFRADEKDGRKIKDRREIRENETAATKYLTLQNISWIRASISGGQFLAAILFSLQTGITFTVSDYAPGMEARLNGKKAGDASSAKSSAFYKQLIPLDNELRKDPQKGWSENWRAAQIVTQKRLKITPDAVKRGLKKARKKA
jgi:hypothetical protein